VLYAKSPGGVAATAERVGGLRPLIAEVAERHDLEPGDLEALVFLESAGRPDAVAGDVEGAVGLGQIVSGTATSLLDMRVDVPQSRRLTRRIERARRRALVERLLGRRRRAERRLAALERRRRAVDERFDPRKALEGTARYLVFARRRLGRDDLALASYHMGVGNLEEVIRLYVAPRRPRASAAETVAAYELTYPHLFYDSSPVRNPRTHAKLASLGDDSRTYLFRLEAAREIIRLHAEDRPKLDRLARLHAAKASAEEVLRPPDDHDPYADARAVREALEGGELVALPARPEAFGLRVDDRMGALAPRLGERAGLYRALRPEALATLLWVAKETRRIAGGGTLRVTSTVRDRGYQRELVGSNAEATRNYSLHTVGYAIDLARPRSDAHERALVDVLERLRALRVIDWVYEPTAIHLTVGPDGERYEPLLTRLEG
jgi:hypothetical protein